MCCLTSYLPILLAVKRNNIHTTTYPTIFEFSKVSTLHSFHINYRYDFNFLVVFDDITETVYIQNFLFIEKEIISLEI
ncbi:MAG: hypothetical protein AUK44_03955 [Porphyromonadaceae bacterium CG2_30_38_12]|nr:MAG: hypothetical protein AUK44_03955 [Porphyromonadaceae bacterium CG2_30_38_12]